MKLYKYKDFEVVVTNELTYTLNFTDNDFNYSNCYFGEGGEDYPTSKHGIKIYQNNKIISNCIIIASGGATDIHENSLLIDNNNLVICCSDTVFCLDLPTLDLKWKIKADDATCFQIFKYNNDYLIHGEILITRISHDGTIKWQFGGRDIFVSSNNDESFKLKEDYIELKDFQNTIYRLNSDGKILTDKDYIL